MAPKGKQAKYFQKSTDSTDEEEETQPKTQPEPEPVQLEITEKKPRKKRVDVSPKPIEVPVGMVTISKAEAKRLKVAEKGPYVMSDKQKANVERLKVLTQERKAKRLLDVEGKANEEKEKLAAKQKEEALILAKASRVRLNVKPPKKRVVKPKQLAPLKVESDVEESEQEETETDYEPPVKQKKKHVRKPKVQVDSESENTDALIQRVKTIKNTIQQAQTGSILSKFF